MEIIYFFIYFALLFQNIQSQDCQHNNSVSIEDCQLQCRIIFKGTKNFYNKQSNYCEIQAVCNDEEIYRISDNTCQTIEDNQNSNGGIDDGSELDFDNIDVENNMDIQCVNGTYIESNIDTKQDQCTCHSGYKDSGTVKNNKVMKCDQIMTEEEQKQNIDYSDQSQVDEYIDDLIADQEGKNDILGIPQYYLILAGFFILFISIIIICYFCCCKKKSNRNKKKKQKKIKDDQSSQYQSESDNNQSESDDSDNEKQVQQKRRKTQNL